MSKLRTFLTLTNPVYRCLALVDYEFLRREQMKNYKELDQKDEQIDYLISMIKRNNVEVDEFDLIALNELF